MISEMNYEKNLIISGRELEYKGIFNINDLYSTINKAIKEQGYEKREKKSEETVKEEGRHVYVELRPWKEVTKWLLLMIKIKIIADNVTETISVVNNEKRVFQKGDVKIIFDGWIMSDYEDRWQMKPFFYFLKTMVNQFIWKAPIESNISGQLEGDVEQIYKMIKQHFDSYRGEQGNIVKEQEIVKKMEMDVEKDIQKEKEELRLD